MCLKAVTHPSANPARPGLTLELVCLLSLFSSKISYPLVKKSWRKHFVSTTLQ